MYQNDKLSEIISIALPEIGISWNKTDEIVEYRKNILCVYYMYFYYQSQKHFFKESLHICNVKFATVKLTLLYLP